MQQVREDGKMNTPNQKLLKCKNNGKIADKETIAKIDALAKSTEAIFKAYESWTKLEIEKERTDQSRLDLEKIRSQGATEVALLNLKICTKLNELEYVCTDRDSTRILLRDLLNGVQKNIEMLLELQKILLLHGSDNASASCISDQIKECCRNYSELISSIPRHLPL